MAKASGQDTRNGPATLYFAETAITEIDGEQGRFTHRSYPVEDLVNQPYEGLVHLLLEGRWPTSEEQRAYCERLLPFRDLPDDLVDLISTQLDASADVVLQISLSYLCRSPGDIPELALVSLAPSIVAAHGALRQGRDILPPDPNLGIPADSLRRLLGRPLTELEAGIINTDFVLHADDGANASAFVARVAASAKAEPLRSLVAAIAVFSGVRHGGAVFGAVEMLDMVTPGDIPEWVRAQTRADAPGTGFEHRDRNVQDPRATLFQQAARDLSLAKGDRTMLTNVEALIEATAGSKRFGVCANADLYAAVVYHLLGIEKEAFTAMIAMSRVAGWLAQIREQRSGSNVLIRPRLRYVGSKNAPQEPAII